MPTIYICGGDIPQNSSKGLVDTDKIKAKLKSLKCAVVNPIEMPFAKMSWTDKLDNRVQLLKKSQAVYVLPNWKENIMSRIELTVAMDLKLETIFHPMSHKEIKQIITALDN
ncbi:MAG: DUF4406 domain-containing protein [Carboxylicivirga sp.]|jgi:hypothetical protein|nr:DUF4406 domain-containing protein [Bacteroidia bacterium]MCT4586438.1 DUF4406 domain-containing protein [Carboxylicivirga sp.]